METNPTMPAPDRPPVFDLIERTDGAPRRNTERTYSFLNRVDGDFWAHPRGLIEQWTSHVVDDHAYKDIRARLQARDDRQFNSALHELFMHELLLRDGYEVTVHPKLSDTKRRPDFYAEKDGVGLYVECIAPGWSNATAAERSRFNRFVDVINEARITNFRLGLVELTQGTADPVASKLRREIERWLAPLDPDGVDDLSAAPTHEWTYEDWSATFCALPLGREARGKQGRAISLFAYEPAASFDGAGIILNALEVKHHKYGALDAPFVVALGTSFYDTNRHHSLRAFWGDDLGSEEERSPEDGGYFGVPGRWRATGVSGVVLVNRLHPAKLAEAEVSVWVHPGADLAMPRLDVVGDRITFDGTRIAIEQYATRLLDYFGLPTPWPPGVPWRTSRESVD